MSQKAFDNNCCRCQTLMDLRKGKIDFDSRACPKVGRIQLTPARVMRVMPADWQCEAKQYWLAQAETRKAGAKCA